MHYYSFHIRDYRSKTCHLTRSQNFIYRLLLDECYLNEKPLPLDPVKCARKIGMSDHLEDVKVVLAEFFEETEYGWVNQRCETDIAAYHAKREKAQKAGIESGRVRRAWAERRENSRRAGVRPVVSGVATADEHPTDGMPTELEQSLDSPSAEPEYPLNARSQTVQATNNQEPITNNQKPSLTPLASSPLPDSTPEAGSAVDNSDSIEVREPPPKAAAAAPPAASAPPVVLIPLQGKDLFGVDQAQIDAWRESYPAVDVLQTLRHIREWCLSNPARKKTRKGVRAFITSWLAREQDAGGARRGMAGVRAPDGPVGRENGDSREAMLARLEASRFCTVNQLNYNEGVGNDGRISL